jgi:REP element-mobilizing transposase RayT
MMIMRMNRIKADHTGTYYHLYNRVAGDPKYKPFGDAEKEQFVRLLHRLQTLFSVRILAYQVMSNHFHLLVYAPKDPPSPQEAAARYSAYYGGKRHISPDSPKCTEMANRMRDISWLMHALQQQFAMWFNRTRRRPRRGTLWAQRFKNTILGNQDAIWKCWRYIERNPVRAGMIDNPANYRFCSYGAWQGTGKHPFQQNFILYMLPALKVRFPARDYAELEICIQHAIENKPRLASSDVEIAVCALDRRARFWIDGRIIGSALFIREVVARTKYRRPSRLPQTQQTNDELLAYNPAV